MNWLQQLADWFARSKCWYIVRPWEQAIRIRLGKHVATIATGFHFRVPFIDEVIVQNVRIRVLNLPVQTVMSSNGHTITLSGVVRWRIVDVRKLYENLHQPEDWIYNHVLAALGEAVYLSDGEASPKDLAAKALQCLRSGSDACGLVIEDVSITDFCRVKTFRLIQGEGNTGWSWTRIGQLPS